MSTRKRIKPQIQSLRIELTAESERLRFSAFADGQATNDHLVNKAELLRNGFGLYTGLQSQIISEVDGSQLCADLGELALAPFAALIDAAHEIVFVLPADLLEVPLDLFHHRGKPLFLQLPTSYNVGTAIHQGAKGGFLGTSFIVSDVTTDPQRACKTVAEMLDSPAYFDVSEVSAQFLREQSRCDLILLSVHGKIVSGFSEYVRLGTGRAIPEDFAALRPKLAYFDSCRLGVASLFIEAFRSVGTICYLAPILSNEAGESSTETIKSFFAQLRQGDRPEDALFKTRKKLWNRYRKDSYACRMWRACPFRVYRLN